jgi:hypothetical protein
MDYFAEQAALFAVKTETGALAIYKAIQTATVEFPGLLQFASICYNSILNDESKKRLDEFIKNDDLLGKYHTKYTILTLAMKSEKMDPLVFINQYEAISKQFLSMVGVNTDNISVDSLKTQLNGHVQDIIEIIKSRKADLSKLLGQIKTGGKTKRKKRKKTKRKKN